MALVGSCFPQPLFCWAPCSFTPCSAYGRLRAAWQLVSDKMMPDWEGLIRRELAGLALSPEEVREVVAELAAHLEETCQPMLRRGVNKDEAVRPTLLQVGNWRHLRRKIPAARGEENSMTNRIK